MATRLATVTGASGGIGSAICDRLRENGFEVRTMDAVGPLATVDWVTGDR